MRWKFKSFILDLENRILFFIMSRRKRLYKFDKRVKFFMSIQNNVIYSYTSLDKGSYGRGANIIK